MAFAISPTVVPVRVAAVFILFATVGSAGFAELVTGPSMPITRRVTVQPVIVSNDDGSNTATFLGNAANEAEIKQNVDTIWAQSGIDIEWLFPGSWDDTYANVGNVVAPGTRPLNDFDQIITDAQTDGVVGVGNVLTLFFLRAVPGNPVGGSAFGADGLADVNTPYTVIRIGDSLPGAVVSDDPLGNQLAAKVISHEIGHNLGLFHLTGDVAGNPNNLMLAGSDAPDPPVIAAVLNSSQSLAVQGSGFVTAIPEPNSLLAVALLLGVAKVRRNRRVGA